MIKTWNDEQFIQAVKASKSITETIRNLGLGTKGANFKTVKKNILRLNLNTDHFLSKTEQLNIARSIRKQLPLDEVLQINNIDRGFVKKSIIKNNLIEYKCGICSITHWQNEKLSLHLDHINGINNDNRLENLRFLCPNCHSLTSSYCGKNNNKNGQKKNCLDVKEIPVLKIKHNNLCPDCQSPIHGYADRCRSCASKKCQPTKIDWCPTLELISMVEKIGYSAVARQLGVSGSAIKKRIRNHPTTS